MKIGFIIQNRNKAPHVHRAVKGALSQTVPCEIILSDQGSTDGSLEVIRKTVADFGPTHHEVRILECPIRGAYGMQACNNHFQWCVDQLSPDVEWVFQCSSDDFSLPDRVAVCMEALKDHEASAIATTQFFYKVEDLGSGLPGPQSGFPTETGYVKAGEGIARLAYGSVIAGYHRNFIERAGSCGPNTMDVLYGYLAALDKGFYVVCNPQHVHLDVASLENAGYGGKLLAAKGDDLMRLNELNHFQLLRVYFACLDRAREMFPLGISNEDLSPLQQTLLAQSHAWMDVRSVLHAKGVTPGVEA